MMSETVTGKRDARVGEAQEPTRADWLTPLAPFGCLTERTSCP